MSRIDGDSAEAVAWTLLVAVAKAEGIDLDKEKAGWPKHKILATYRECLAAVRSSDGRERESSQPANVVSPFARQL